MVERSEVKRRSALPDASKKASPPHVGRRERNKQEKLARIVAAARRLFNENGFQETTTQQIAEAADIGTGTLFLYAKSKEDLLIMVFKDEMIETSRAAFTNLPAGGALLDQLVHVFDQMVRYHERDLELTRILLREIMFQSSNDRADDIIELMQVVYGGITDLLVSAQKAGTLRPDQDPLLTAQVLFASYFMDLVSWLRGRETKQQFLDRLRQMLAISLGGAV